jgi:hypothetical protein
MCVGAHCVNPKIVVTIILGSVRAVQVSPMAFHWQPLDIGGHCFRWNRTTSVLRHAFREYSIPLSMALSKKMCEVMTMTLGPGPAPNSHACFRATICCLRADTAIHHIPWLLCPTPRHKILATPRSCMNNRQHVRDK